MATPASTPRPQGSSAGPSTTTSWTRSGEPGSAFSGIGRGRARGGGSGGRGRSGRGGRGGVRDTKPIGVDTVSEQSATPKNASTPAMKSTTLPNLTATDKSSISSSNTQSSARAKGNSRRPSRTVAAVVVPPPNPTIETPGTPGTPLSQNRKRRSQAGKPVAQPLPKINVPAHDDNLLRPRHRIGQAPHTAPLKDTPPHLAGASFDIRHNIDALVERVRAVAMDHRPSTPGSHLDWAGDDDDSLPDLDDWGVTTTSVASDKANLISPIAVGSLKPLPDVDLETSSSALDAPDLSPDPILHDQISGGKSSPAIITNPETTAQNPLSLALDSAKVSLHPSLPAKPAITADVSSILPNSRQDPGATSMRKHSTPTPLNSAAIQNRMKGESPHVSVTTDKEQGLAESIHSPPAQGANTEDPFVDILSRDGLVASIHAPTPGSIEESKSAPSNISSYSSSSTEPRTHTRAHTIGRPFPRPEHHGRPSRSGYTSPRGGRGHHSRTHSTPPAGLHNHRSPTHRPVITGDAMSRLARTIGGTKLSPGRNNTVTSSTHD